MTHQITAQAADESPRRASLKTRRIVAAPQMPCEQLYASRILFTLAVASLVLAGAFALWLVVGRLPGLSGLVSDAQFFKRCLVVHVDLSLIVWFFAFSGGLFTLIAGNASTNRASLVGSLIASTGVLVMIAGTLAPGSQPVLSNYVPVIDHPIFLGGLAAFFVGLLICFVNGRLFSRSRELLGLIPASAVLGLKAAAVIFALAMIVLLSSAISAPRFLEPKVYYELLFWGGGHVLQAANVAAMLAVWIVLLSSLLNRPVIQMRAAGILFGLLALPYLFAPLLTVEGVTSSHYRTGFTQLMRWGIFPVTLVFLGIAARELRRAWLDGALTRRMLLDVRFVGFAASVAMTLVGFVLGACIRSSTTLIPAHYHASIGAVTAAFMAGSYLMARPLGFSLPLRWHKLASVQVGTFAAGQLLFALGFSWAGIHGLGRKAYAAEQHVRTFQEHVGLGVMGVGGLIAVAGGLMFLVFMTSARPRASARPSLVSEKLQISPV